MQVELIGNRVAVVPFDYGSSGKLSVLNLEAGKGYDFNEAEHFPRVGKVVAVSNDELVEDEYRIIENYIDIGDIALFPHNAIVPADNINVDNEKAFIIPVTSIIAIKRWDNTILAFSDNEICEKEEVKNALGEVVDVKYIAKYISAEMEYKPEFGFDNVAVNKGDVLILSADPYEVENPLHYRFFDKPMYAVAKHEIIGVKHE